MYGTMAHSYVISFTESSDLGKLRILKGVDIVERAKHYRDELKVLKSSLNVCIVDKYKLFRVARISCLCQLQ